MVTLLDEREIDLKPLLEVDSFNTAKRLLGGCVMVELACCTVEAYFPSKNVQSEDFQIYVMGLAKLILLKIFRK